MGLAEQQWKQRWHQQNSGGETLVLVSSPFHVLVGVGQSGGGAVSMSGFTTVGAHGHKGGELCEQRAREQEKP